MKGERKVVRGCYSITILSVQIPTEVLTPCSPSPCGANAICKARNGAGSCTCLADYTGNPYEECRPECIHNSDCPSNKACTKNRCVDPCPGTCGQNANCQVINHSPSCSCLPGYTGDPFRFCNLPAVERKTLRTQSELFLTLLSQLLGM
jgi:hypothetical protein